MDILDALPLTSRRKPPVSPSYCNPNPRLTTPSLSLTRKLKRMPHLFTRTLELPFQADTVVKVAESRDSYTFAAWLPGLGARDVKVEVLEIVPGATKVVLRGLECLLPSNADDLEVCNFLRFLCVICKTQYLLYLLVCWVGSPTKARFISTSTPLPCQKDSAEGRKQGIHVMTNAKCFPAIWLNCKLVISRVQRSRMLLIWLNELMTDRRLFYSWGYPCLIKSSKLHWSVFV